jgi:hypothetical protein
MFMRPTIFSAVILMLSALLVSDPGLRAAESAAQTGGSQKSGKRSTEGDRKSSDKGEKGDKTAEKPAEKSTDKAAASNAGAPAAAEPVKRKATSSKSAASKAGTEDERFANARKAASEDPKVVELKEKADLAKTQDAGARAMRSYLRALYGKMRTLEPSLEERIDLTEAAALKAVSKGE